MYTSISCLDAASRSSKVAKELARSIDHWQRFATARKLRSVMACEVRAETRAS